MGSSWDSFFQGSLMDASALLWPCPSWSKSLPRPQRDPKLELKYHRSRMSHIHAQSPLVKLDKGMGLEWSPAMTTHCLAPDSPPTNPQASTQQNLPPAEWHATPLGVRVNTACSTRVHKATDSEPHLRVTPPVTQRRRLACCCDSAHQASQAYFSHVRQTD